MINIHETKNLEIVAYADVLHKPTVIHRVAPIFSISTDTTYLIPPFRLIDNLVIDGKVIPTTEFERHIKNQVTLIDPKLQAIPKGMLWIDEGLKVHYGQQDEENNKLYEQAAEKVKQGLKALSSGNLEEAIKCARWASAANQESLKPLVLEAAVYKIQKSEPGFNLMRKMLEGVPDAHYFDEEVDSLIKQYEY